MRPTIVDPAAVAINVRLEGNRVAGVYQRGLGVLAVSVARHSEDAAADDGQRQMGQLQPSLVAARSGRG